MVEGYRPVVPTSRGCDHRMYPSTILRMVPLPGSGRICVVSPSHPNSAVSRAAIGAVARDCLILRSCDILDPAIQLQMRPQRHRRAQRQQAVAIKRGEVPAIIEAITDQPYIGSNLQPLQRCGPVG